MADGKTHFAVSAMCAGIGAIALLAVGEISKEGVLVLFACGIIGGMLPDIDSGHSPALNGALSSGGVLLSFLAVFSQSHRYAIMELLVIWLVVYLAFRVILVRLLLRMTTHRGIIHSVPMAMVGGLLGVVLLYQVFGFSLAIAWMGGVFLFLGFFGHLCLDELYSLNLFGAGQRMAMGSALKFFSKEWRPSVLVWLLVVALGVLSPPPHRVFDSWLGDGVWQKLGQRLMPTGSWFIH